jgi:hypothetical protein
LRKASGGRAKRRMIYSLNSLDSRPEVFAFGGVVAGYILLHNFLRKTIPSEPLNFEDKTLKSRWISHSLTLSVSVSLSLWTHFP